MYLPALPYLLKFKCNNIMAEHHPLRTTDQYPKTAAYAQLNADAERRGKECRSVEMPSLDHLRMRDYNEVYEPSDDTYLLIDAIGLDMDMMEDESKDGDDEILKHCNINRTLEIGCGTGTPSVYLAMRLGKGRSMVCDGKSNNSVAATEATDYSKETTAATNPHEKDDDSTNSTQHYVTDINPAAIRIAKSTAENNGIPISDFLAHQCDLASGLLEQLQNKVDILIFNPPYVPTPDDEVGSDSIEASWAGGKDGRVVLDRALPQIAQLLTYPLGVAYIVTVDDNYPEQIGEMMDKEYGIKVIPWMRRRARNEFLTILKMTPTREFGSSN